MTKLRLADLVLLSLATWRLTRLMQTERGPKAILARFRALFGVQHGPEGTPTAWPPTELGMVLACPWCGSVWVGGLFAWLWLRWPRLAVWLALPLALSAGSLWIERAK